MNEIERAPWRDADCAGCGRGLEVEDGSVEPVYCGDCADYISARATETLSYGDIAHAQSQGWCSSSPDGMGPHRPDYTADPVTCAECGTEIEGGRVNDMGMLTIILHENGQIEAMHDFHSGETIPHIVVVNERERWTDSPAIATYAPEAEQAEQIAAYRNGDFGDWRGGYEDRNP